jgi:hypothetical protein
VSVVLRRSKKTHTHTCSPPISLIDVGTVAAGVQACHGIIANVRSGSHWVLLTGFVLSFSCLAFGRLG